MGKLALYIVVLGTILILFHFAGLITRTPDHYLFQIILGGWASTPLIGKVTAFLSAAGLAAVTIGTLTGGTAEIPMKILFMVGLGLTMGVDIFAIGQKIVTSTPGSVGMFLAAICMAPLALLFFFTIIEWITGRD